MAAVIELKLTNCRCKCLVTCSSCSKILILINKLTNINVLLSTYFLSFCMCRLSISLFKKECDDIKDTLDVHGC